MTNLRKSDDIIWYFKVKDSNKFDILKNRELTFSDEFDRENLDTQKMAYKLLLGREVT